jgi:hypothetical protein
LHDALLAASDNAYTTGEVGSHLDLTSSKIDTILDNIIDTFIDYILKVVAGESVLRIMRTLLDGDNQAYRTLSFRHSVLQHIKDQVKSTTVTT